jgi:ribosome-associated protein
MTTETAAKKDTQKLQRAIVDGLEDVKGQDIQVFNTEHLSPLFERVIVASGTSNRQTKALASSVIDAVREAGFPKPRIEGEDNGEWIIVDCGAAVAHIMQPAIRQYYHLEEIWGDKPIRLRLGAPKPATPEREGAPAKKVSPSLRRSSAVKTAERDAKRESEAAKKAPARKTAGKSAAGKTAAKAPAKAPAKTAAKAPAKSTAVSTARTAAGKAALKAPAKTPARKSAAAGKTPAKKTPARG